MTLLGHSTLGLSRRIHDPSWATFVRAAGSLGYRLPRATDRVPLAPSTHAPSGLHSPLCPRPTPRRPPCCPPERAHRAPRSAIQIP
jgi:hypothetical protein